MNDRPEDERRGDEAGIRDPVDDTGGETSNLPSVDPRPQADTDALPEAPPIDIDQRDAGVSHADPPEVIELPDHADAREEEPDPLERPLDNEFQPLPMDHDSDDQPPSRQAPATDVASDGSVPAADDLHWVPSGSPVPGTAPHPTFERVRDESGDPSTEEKDSPRERFVRIDDQRENAGPSERAGGTGVLGGLGDAVKSARTTLTDGADDTTDTSERGEGFLGMLKGAPGTLLDPSLHASTTLPHRMLLVGGAIVILLSLLSNNAGLALIVASAIVPVSIALTLNQQDLFEKESTLLITAVGAAGLVIGVIFSSLSAWLVSGNWFNYGVLNYGAAGFGGRFADLAGAAPFVVWFISGLVLPLLALGAIIAVPIAMRRWAQFRNEVMDGVLLCGTSAAGFAIGSALVFWAPLLTERGPQTSVADWTLTALGVVLLRPIVITLAGAMLGAGVWKYMMTPSPGVMILPALGSIGGILLLNFGSLQLQPSGLWSEAVWTLLIAIASFMVYRLVLNSAISSDRKVVAADQARVVCPSCRRITPAGAFCAHCGAVLEQEPAPAA